MLVSAFLTLVRDRIRDSYKLEYFDPELIGYINDAISYWSSCSVANKDLLKIKTISVSPYVDIPTNFAHLVGAYPVSIESGRLISNTGDTVLCKYYCYDDSVTSTTDTLSYSSPEISILLQLTCLYALNRNQFDVTSETALSKALSDVVSASKVKS